MRTHQPPGHILARQRWDALFEGSAGPALPAAEPRQQPHPPRHSHGPDLAHPGGTLVSLVTDQAARTPEAPAVEAPDGSVLTYRALVTRAERMATGLRARGVTPGTLVGLAVQPSADLIPALLGILAAGAAYVPLDSADPSARTAAVLADAAPIAVLADAAEAFRLPAGPPVWQVDDIATEGRCRYQVRAEDPAYVIYTSGSTGRPKGVVVPHRAIVARVRALRELYPLTSADRVLHKAHIAFDVSLTEIFRPAGRGRDRRAGPARRPPRSGLPGPDRRRARHHDRRLRAGHAGGLPRRTRSRRMRQPAPAALRRRADAAVHTGPRRRGPRRRPDPQPLRPHRDRRRDHALAVRSAPVRSGPGRPSRPEHLRLRARRRPAAGHRRRGLRRRRAARARLPQPARHHRRALRRRPLSARPARACTAPETWAAGGPTVCWNSPAAPTTSSRCAATASRPERSKPCWRAFPVCGTRSSPPVPTAPVPGSWSPISSAGPSRPRCGAGWPNGCPSTWSRPPS